MLLKRSKWKYNYVHKDLFKAHFLKKNIKIMKVLTRGSTVLPLFLNMSVGVYDGYSFFKINFKSHMVGHKLGEFVKTRQTFRYGKK